MNPHPPSDPLQPHGPHRQPQPRSGCPPQPAAHLLLLLLLGLVIHVSQPDTRAAELLLDFASLPTGALTNGFQPALTGSGPAPDWRLISVASTSALPAVLESRPVPRSETVLAQLSTDPTDERFPLLVYQGEEFGDFTATLKFRTVSGLAERMAGLAFRLRDEKNYYVIRASSLGNTLRFYKFVDGVRSDPIGIDLTIPAGEWHTLEISARGNQIRSRLDGKEGIPMLTDTSFTRGKLALWTKSDSVSHFSSLRVVYDVVKTLPQRLVERAREKFPRLLEVAVFARQDGQTVCLASTDTNAVGRVSAATGSENKALDDGTILAAVHGGTSSTVFPLRDRNGDPLFAVRLKLKSFAGQTEANAASRGKTVADDLETLVRAAERDDVQAVRVR